MIHNPWALAFILLVVEVSILYLASNPPTKSFFSFIPSMFWIYFLPMVLSTLGIIDAKNLLYSAITKYLLPPALFLLLFKVDFKAISRLVPAALIMFFAGTLGMMLGMVISFVIFKPWVGRQFWGGFGALAASWTGGSANMIAVKEALNVPDPVFFPMVIIDTIWPYTWVGILVALAGRQKIFDAWNRADRRILDELGERLNKGTSPMAARLNWRNAFLILALAFGVGLVSQDLSAHLPTAKNMFTPYAWTVILVTTIAIMLSLTPVNQLTNSGSDKTGKWILYFVLTSIGARASLSNASQVGILLAAGGLVLLVHVAVLLITARLIRAPLFLAATASLANMAGLVSAPVVAEVYQPGFACVGLLLAILGHSLGAYNGILTGQICRLFIH